MTIDQINPSIPHPGKAPAKDTGSIKGGDLFRQTLDKALEPLQDKEAPPLSAPPSLEEVTASEYYPRTSAPESTLQERTGDLLDLLDRFSSQLENPDITLKAMEPTIHDLKACADKLMKDADDVPGDSPLREIAREAAMTADKEYFKFQRGDYV